MVRLLASRRRDGSFGHADRLEGHFGLVQTFMDVDGIKPGLDIVEIVQIVGAH